MSAYRWRSYVVEVIGGGSRGALYLQNIAEVRRLLAYLSPLCTHADDGTFYRFERVWFDNGFDATPSPGESIRFPSVLSSSCVCKIAEAVA
ncbi:hypothetical protein ACR5KS_08990 [Leucobacter sp. W1153]|uniref:hypothetical protein n=1 Tax=Leucobacter sp. W1153 TaxID=3439064 RepID=UPI003F31813C